MVQDSTRPLGPSTNAPAWAARYPSLPYILPFVLFLALLAIQDQLAALGRLEFPLRVLILAVALYFCSRHVIDLRVRHALPTIGIGIAVFVLWIAPDLLFPGYRNSVLFQNSIMGQVRTSVPADLLGDPVVLTFRTIRAVVLVPIIEELFWRAWLLRWLIDPDFQKIRLGAFTLSSFLISALLFASEHGPYWDVGFAAGVIYNGWMIRTKSLGDCILAHAVTNGILCAYVIATGSWQYWL